LFETQVYEEVTNVKQYILFDYLYVLPPGVYGTVATSNSLSDSTGLRAFDRTVNGASIITQEDQCTDEETDHTTPERVFVMVVGEQTLQSSCVRCRAVFAPVVHCVSFWVPDGAPYSRGCDGCPKSLVYISPVLGPNDEPYLSTSLPTHAPTTQSPSVSPSVAPSAFPSVVLIIDSAVDADFL